MNSNFKSRAFLANLKAEKTKLSRLQTLLANNPDQDEETREYLEDRLGCCNKRLTLALSQIWRLDLEVELSVGGRHHF